MKRELVDTGVVDVIMIIGLICFVGWICYFSGYAGGKLQAKKESRQELIDRGYAIHNPTNGVWQWK